jgi:hypothetical protein
VDGGRAPAASVADLDYRASENGRALQARNPAHRLRTYFTSSGISVHDRFAGDQLIDLRLSGIGRGEALTAVADGEVVSEGTRVEIRRPGIVEWYVNSPAGPEHGFTVPAPPEGEGKLGLELALRGATPSVRGDALIFTTPTGRNLSYGSLTAVGARRRHLSSRFEVLPTGAVRVSVDDEGAVYPVVIDPLLTALGRP